jgi:hypothetical protein
VSEAESDPVEEAWARVESAWDDDAEHTRFVKLCSVLGRLPDAGKRYRAVRDSDPQRRASAEAQIDKLFGVAMEALAATRTEPEPRRARVALLVVALLLAALLIGASAYVLLHGLG